MPRVKLLIAERWDAVTPRERLAFMRYGRNPAPWETPPQYAARILKFDPRISLAAGRSLAVIFQVAYDEMVRV